ncbi:hypothetical protein [Aeromicrobium sp. CF3.5]
MGMMRKAGAFGVAKMVFDEARKPQNQARIKRAVQQVKDRRNQGRTPPR